MAGQVCAKFPAQDLAQILRAFRAQTASRHRVFRAHKSSDTRVARVHTRVYAHVR
jgi:hypothetical protein